MRIGIDALPLVPPRTGIGHYTYELARSLAELAPGDDVELISPFPLELAGFERASQDGWPANLRAAHARRRRFGRLWWALGLPVYLRGSPVSVFHGTNYSVPLLAACPTLLSIHDLSLLLYPETHEEHLVRRARRRLPLMARAATMIVTDTESVRREVCQHLRVEAARTAAVPIAPRRVFRRATDAQVVEVRRRLGVEEEFLLYVGTIEPRKNLLTLVRAFEEVLRATGLRPQLVIAGKRGWLSDELFAYVRGAGLGAHIRFTGYVADEDLRALYTACRACVYPSLYEGFGLPPLEAMACGAPVIASRIPAIEETAGAAARLVPPTDVPALARAIVELLTDEAERRHLSTRGEERAAQFSWERTARATLDLYREALTRAGGKR